MATDRIVHAKAALFIKLGENGFWEKECINSGTLWLGYHNVPHDLCLQGNWQEARTAFDPKADAGAVTRHINQVQQFYEAPADTLWVTFFSDRLWWCFSTPSVELSADHSKVRRTIEPWCDKDISGAPLLKSRLSGKLLAVQGFQGTICSIRELEYLLHKINGTSEPHVLKAQTAVDDLTASIVPLIRNLHPKDLETLTDLIFRQAGWQRSGVSGGTEKDIDLDLQSPITQERIAVQVKSKASAATFRSYRDKYADMLGFSRFYFVTHSPDPSLQKIAADVIDPSFVLWTADHLALQAVRNGLVGWIIDKAS